MIDIQIHWNTPDEFTLGIHTAWMEDDDKNIAKLTIIGFLFFEIDIIRFIVKDYEVEIK